MQTDEDKRFVIASWLDASRSSYSAGLCPMSLWYDVTWPIYDGITQRPGMRTMIAHDQDDPTGYIGFIVADPTEQRVPGRDGAFRWWPALVVFLYVKAPYRRQGFARRLFESVGIDPTKAFLYASNTVTASRLVSKVPLAKFDPLCVRFPKENA